MRDAGFRAWCLGTGRLQDFVGLPASLSCRETGFPASVTVTVSYSQDGPVRGKKHERTGKGKDKGKDKDDKDLDKAAKARDKTEYMQELKGMKVPELKQKLLATPCITEEIRAKCPKMKREAVVDELMRIHLADKSNQSIVSYFGATDPKDASDTSDARKSSKKARSS